MAVSLSALRAGRLFPPGYLSGTHFCYRLSRLQGHIAAGKIRSIEEHPITSSGIEPPMFRPVA
jgi:hypothetical protein